MNHELTDKHVLIAGGSKGIGLACARTFLAEGARVTLVLRFQENLIAAQAALLKEAPGATVDILAADALTAAAWHDDMQAKFFTYIHVFTSPDQTHGRTRPRRFGQHHRLRRQSRNGHAPRRRRG